MVERTPFFDFLSHLILLTGIGLIVFPLYLVFNASTHTLQEVNQIPPSMLPGTHFWENIKTAWQMSHFGEKFINSAIIACGVVIGKITISGMTAFGIVFFNHRLRMPIFWIVFITLMLPLEVRIVPTYAVAANALSPFQTILDLTGLNWLVEQISGQRIDLEWNLLNSYTGMILPLVATATGTFLYRQFFLTIPDYLVESAKMDGVGPIRFFWEILAPLSRTNIAALATIMFIYSWNLYLWPLLVVTDPHYSVVAMELRNLVPGSGITDDTLPIWHIAMAATLFVSLPPVLVVIFMQRWFVRGLIRNDQ